MGSHAGWCCVPAGCNDHIQRSCRCSAADRRRRERSGCMRTTLCGSRTHRTRLSRSRPPRTPRPTHCAHGAACDAGAGARPCPARGGMSSWVLLARASLRLRSLAPLRGAARVRSGRAAAMRDARGRAASFFFWKACPRKQVWREDHLRDTLCVCSQPCNTTAQDTTAYHLHRAQSRCGPDQYTPLQTLDCSARGDSVHVAIDGNVLVCTRREGSSH